MLNVYEKILPILYSFEIRTLELIFFFKFASSHHQIWLQEITKSVELIILLWFIFLVGFFLKLATSKFDSTLKPSLYHNCFLIRKKTLKCKP